MSKSDIKKCFKSRFDGGYIVEYDYAQLEIVGLAVLSDDPQLKSDLKNGLDLHCVNTAQLYRVKYEEVFDAYHSGDPEWTEKRKKTKQMSFQLQYGAGAKSMAESADVPLELAKQFIKEYYNRYPMVKSWQDNTMWRVQTGALPATDGVKTTRGYPAKKSVLETLTGRKFTFREKDSPEFMRDKGVMTSFSPTEVKNYPVQGFSTGDFMMVALQQLYKHLLKINFSGGKILPVNTIHDSIILDIHKDTPIYELNEIKDVLETVPKNLNETYPELNFDLDVHVDVEIGSNWGEMTDLKTFLAEKK